jgi:hypothetical protein
MENIYYSNIIQITYFVNAFFFFFFGYIIKAKIEMILVRSVFWKQNGATFLLSTLFSKKKKKTYNQYIQVQ